MPTPTLSSMFAAWGWRRRRYTRQLQEEVLFLREHIAKPTPPPATAPPCENAEQLQESKSDEVTTL